MLIEKLKKTRRNTLDKSDLLGSYDFFTTIVSIESCEEQDIVNLNLTREEFSRVCSNNDVEDTLSFSTYEFYSKVYPVATHEYTHFIDCTSTLWGMRYLKSMSDAYSSDNLRFGATEEDFFRAKEFNDLVRFIKMPDYYRLVAKKEEHPLPWSYRESIGKVFTSKGKVSDRPLLFIWFSDASGEPIVRSPISPLSILEGSAMCQEILGRSSLISLLGEERVIEEKMYQNYLKNYLFDASLTEYSVCAHLLGTKFEKVDTIDVFSASATLCRYVLNTPLQVYEMILSHFDFCTLWQNNPIYSHVSPDAPEMVDFVKNIKEGLKRHDLGMLFYLIFQLLPFSIKSGEIHQHINDVYSKLGITKEQLVQFVVVN
ncbi:hypothetical protein K6U55_08320 [Vibrio diabolicus]|uniref:hypothetical protein n=3 Tax=Vibrio diabolicus TaxID=50719 RepID=UPI00211AB9FE|nr:hypothetical protein [Vibrio diabolicus]MCG6242045.1 hypothetical protein [Vibrio diabolicus]